MRVPTPTGSITDLVAILSKDASIDAINDAFRAASAHASYRGVLEYTDEPLVSADIVQNPASCIFSARRHDGERQDGQGARLVRQRVGLLEPPRRPGRVRRLQVVATPSVRWSIRFRSSRTSPLERGTRVLAARRLQRAVARRRDRRRPAHHRRAADDQVPARRAAPRSCAARTSAGRRARSTRSTRSRRSPSGSSELLGTEVELSPEVAGFESLRAVAEPRTRRRDDDREPALRSGRGGERSRVRREPRRARRRLRRRRVRRRAPRPRVDRRAAAGAAVAPPGRLLAREVEVLGGLLDDAEAPVRRDPRRREGQRQARCASTRCSNAATRCSSAARWRSRSSPRRARRSATRSSQADQVDALPRAADDRAASRSRPTSSSPPR